MNLEEFLGRIAAAIYNGVLNRPPTSEELAMDITHDQLMQMNMEQAFWAGVPSLAQVERALDVWNMHLTMIGYKFFPSTSENNTKIVDPTIGAPTLKVQLDVTPSPDVLSDAFSFLDLHMPRNVPGVRCLRGAMAMRIPQSASYVRLLHRKLAECNFPHYAGILKQLSDIQDSPGLFDDDNPGLHIRPSNLISHRFVCHPDTSPRGYIATATDALRSSTSVIYEDDYMEASRVPMYSLREFSRIRVSDYIPLPAHVINKIDKKTMVKEIPHLAVKGSNRGKIAYTENAKKGTADIQSIMKPGKYLRRALKDSITDKELKEVVAELYGAATFEIKITTDPEVAKQVYLNGPSSCMSKGRSFFDTEDDDGVWRHPIEALFDYDNDIALIYVMNGDRPCARALLNTDTMTYPATYIGDWAKNARSILNDWLDMEGYSQCDEALENQPIAKIHVGHGRYLCPYIDSGNLGVEFEHDRMIVGGELKASYQNGWVSEDDREDTEPCEHCGDGYHTEHMTRAEWDDELYCDDCYVKVFCQAVSEDGCDITTMPIDSTIELPRFVNRHFVSTDRAHGDIDNSGLLEVGLIRLDSNGEIHDECDCVCTSDGEWVHIDDVFGPNDPPNLDRPYSPYESHATDANDNEVMPLCDMVWDVENNEWRHESDVDLDRVQKAGNGIRFIPEPEEDEDAQDVA